jgi:uncharacterized protein (DUF305 family)
MNQCPDVGFAMMMRVHHQALITMAEAELRDRHQKCQPKPSQAQKKKSQRLINFWPSPTIFAPKPWYARVC